MKRHPPKTLADHILPLPHGIPGGKDAEPRSLFVIGQVSEVGQVVSVIGHRAGDFRKFATEVPVFGLQPGDSFMEVIIHGSIPGDAGVGQVPPVGSSQPGGRFSSTDGGHHATHEPDHAPEHCRAVESGHSGERAVLPRPGEGCGPAAHYGDEVRAGQRNNAGICGEVGPCSGDRSDGQAEVGRHKSDTDPLDGLTQYGYIDGKEPRP